VIRFFNTYFPARTVILGVSEAVLVTVAFLLAMVANLGRLNASIELNYEQGIVKIALVSVAFLVCMYYFDLYDSLVLSNRREVFIRTVQALGTLCLLFAGIYYVFPSMHLSGKIFLTGTVLLGCGLAIWRPLFLLINRNQRLSEPCLILGDGPLAQELINELSLRPELGLRAVSHVKDEQQNLANGALTPFFSDELIRIVQQQNIRRIVVVMRERRGRLPVEELLRLKTLGITIQNGIEVYEAITGKIAVESLQLSWLLFSPGFQLPRPLLLYKRIFSLIGSAVGLLLTMPLMAIIAVLIRLDSRGPIIYRQKRVGKNGCYFTLYKFRSMVDKADADDNFKPATKDDARFTRFGRWLRATRMDELPQLYNILRGDMYFVGPRPFVPSQEEECVRNIPYYKQRWSVKPGATGWAQVNRDYCATLADNAEKLAYDLFYIKNVSIGLDLLILFKTAKILLLGRGGR
jgi:sugar transferase (PEP-CTERM system associated)